MRPEQPPILSGLETLPAGPGGTNSDVPTAGGGPVGQVAYGSVAKDMPVYRIRAEKCAIVGVKATIEGQFYVLDGSKWRENNGQTRDSISIDSVTETEVDVPMLRRRVILTPAGPCFFTAKAEEGFVCVSVGEVESAIRNGLPLNALVIPGSSRVVIELARHFPTPYALERREESEITHPASPEREAAEALMRMRGPPDMRGPLYDPPQSHPCPSSSGVGRGTPPGAPPHYITAPESGSFNGMADWPSSYAQAPVTEQTVRYNHQEPRTYANCTSP